MQIPALLNPLIGNLADRISVRWFVVAAPMMTAVAMSLIGLAPSYGVLLLFVVATPAWLRIAALLLAGFSLLATTPVMLALVQENAHGNPAAANGWFMMISFIARSAVVVIVGFCGDLLGLRITYLLSAGLGLLALAFLRMLATSKRPIR